MTLSLLSIKNVFKSFIAGYRLAGNGSDRQGRLEVEVRGIWGTICDDTFTDIDAEVACYELGFG